MSTLIDENTQPSRKSALPSKEERLRKKNDPFANASPLVSNTKPDAASQAVLAQRQEASAEQWQAAHDADAPRRARVVEMKGCLEGQCCYIAPGKMHAGPSVYNVKANEVEDQERTA